MMAKPRPTLKSEKMCDDIIERVSSGATLTSICRLASMPSKRTLMTWLSKDDKLDERMHRARVRGTMLIADEAVDAQREIIGGKRMAFDNRQIQALMAEGKKLDIDVDIMRQLAEAVRKSGRDPKQLQAAVTAANNLGHQANAKLSKIDNRYKDKAPGGGAGFFVGWLPAAAADEEVTGSEALEDVAKELGLDDVPIAGEA